MSLSRNAKAKLTNALSNGPEAEEIVEALDGYIVHHNGVEEDTGKIWINGKKIFRKVITFTDLPATASTFLGVISGVDVFTDIAGILQPVSGGVAFHLGFQLDTNIYFNASASAGSGAVNVFTNLVETNNFGHLIIEYTKV